MVNQRDDIDRELDRAIRAARTNYDKAMTPRPGEVTRHRFPWNEQAVLLRDLGEGEREITKAGTLAEVAATLEAFGPINWQRLHISLPDRGAPPFEYGPDDFGTLVRER